jgi:hypothetical protein
MELKFLCLKVDKIIEISLFKKSGLFRVTASIE